jgi:hypothetical protein
MVRKWFADAYQERVISTTSVMLGILLRRQEKEKEIYTPDG